MRKQLDGRQAVMLSMAEAAADRRQHFFYILIREPLKPVDRETKYAEPLNEALGELGEVSGGGSLVGEDKVIEFCGLDVVVNHRENGLKLIRECLRACGAGPHTVIEEYLPEFVELPL